MPKGYKNKDENKGNEVYKPSGLLPKGYKNDHSNNYTPTTTTTKSVNWKAIMAIIIPILLIFIVWMVVRYTMTQQWEQEDAKLLEECYKIFGRTSSECAMYE